MTAPTLPIVGPADDRAARPGSRAARMALPRAVDALKDLAAEHGVCIRPVALRRTDLTTGQTELIDLPCGATLEAKCPPCAQRAHRLRQVQIREGWHRTDEPNPGPAPATDDQKALISLRAHFEYYRAQAEREAQWDQVTELDEAIAEVEQAIAAEGLRGRIAPPHGRLDGEDQDDADRPRRVRSTKRRQDVPDLPRQRVAPRTLGRTYTGTDGTVHQPSMWLTLTLDTYGAVHSVHPGRPCGCRRRHTDDDPLLGSPIDPSTYDYRRAAWDAVHFPRLLDRLWQNMRRAVGWNVQYAGCVEPQRRLAPHAHFAIRGTIARAMLEKVAAATYHQVWWPPAYQLRYPIDRPPVFDHDAAAWVDPDTVHRCRPGARPSTPSTPTPTPDRRTSSGSDRRSRPRASNRAAATWTAPSATSPSTSPKRPPTATPPARIRSASTSTGSGTNCAPLRVRNGALTGCSTACNPGRPTPGSAPETARAGCTRRPPSASAAAASWSPATGPAKPWPTTAPTPTPGSKPSSASAPPPTQHRRPTLNSQRRPRSPGR